MDCKNWKTNIPAWVKVYGEDAEAYLQSQFSQAITTLSTGESTYGLLLSLKGKVRADGFINRVDSETFQIVSYHCSASTLIEILEENVIADEVEFEKLGTGGSFVTLDSSAKEQYPNAIVFPGRWMKQPHWDVILPEGESTRDDCSSMKGLERIRIQDGMVAVPSDIGPNELPQEGRLEEVAVCFNKGCFLGQEVMARLKAMGKVQKSIFLIKGTGEAPASGSEIYRDNKKGGELRSTCRLDEENAWIGLALLRWKMVEDKDAGNWFIQPNTAIEILEKV